MSVKEVHIVFQVMNFVYSDASHEYQLLPVHRLLLILFAKHSGAKGIYPSISTLAKELQLTSRYIKTCITYLEKINLIKIVRKNGCSSYYFLEFLSTDRGTVEHRGTTDHRGTVDHPTGELQITHRGTTDHPINTNNQNRTKTERGGKERAPSSLLIFKPDEQSVLLAKDLGLNLDAELASFHERHKGKKTQYEFQRWLKAAKEYAMRKKAPDNEVRSTVKFWAPGNPDYDRLQNPEREIEIEEENRPPVEVVNSFEEVKAQYIKQHGALPDEYIRRNKSRGRGST